MKNKIVIIVVICLFTAGVRNIKAEDSFKRQLFKNINIGWDVNKTYDYRWSNFSLGTAYGQKFEFDPQASWQVGLNYNWSKYTLYGDGNYALSASDEVFRTQSITIPLTVEYKLFNSFFSGMKVYTGPVYELILASSLNRNYYPGVSNNQFGWTLGTKIRFFAILNARLAYNYYPTGLFSNGNLNRSAVSFSVGF